MIQKFQQDRDSSKGVNDLVTESTCFLAQIGQIESGVPAEEATLSPVPLTPRYECK